ncbi:MAG: DNA repair exonuclease [Candidatus Margulisbacteria bacterium]|nr:DNA repair exonuclease [Candidatus Margulisiibacteriota bacterium]MBU1021437.1 DNA repair exonuclease [Candidatus Margulisiibacteriota bacterium]MBU1728358.1 DNA repair exonuclease [Candidatus Margulisiibacteriota bacterium]MBU1955899.1 DNA repair exonuclease [Candidatus Margulisiibacteriota bacterium]
MKFVHISDTHLGYAAYRKLSENGYNQREEDALEAFRQAVDKIIELKPDFVLHGGDLFDIVRPTNRIIHFAIEQLLRLVNAKIPTVIISGNHETPKQRYIGNVFKIIEALPVDPELLRIVYNMQYQTLTIGDATIHAIPQCRNGEEFDNELKKLKPVPNTKNIVLAHCGVKGMKEFAHGDFNELLIDYEELRKMPFDYIALGHFHNFTKITERAFFSGSTERMSFNEAGIKKGFIEVTLETELKTKFHELKIRTMAEIPSVNAKGKDVNALTGEIENHIQQSNPKDKIMRMKIKNISPAVLSVLDVKKIRESAKAALHFEPIFEKITEAGEIEILKTNIGGLNEEYIYFIETSPALSKEEKSIFKEQGLHYLGKALEETEKPL